MKHYFTEIEIKVKPHIAHYLNYHFGSPCKITSGHFILEFVKLALSSNVKQHDHKITSLTETVLISISEDEFNRYGHTVTKTNSNKLNDAIDNYIRCQIRSLTDIILSASEANEDWKTKYIKLHQEHSELVSITELDNTEEKQKLLKKFQIKLNKRIKEFEHQNFKIKDALIQSAYVQLGFNEQVLPFETIKKDYYRNKIRENT